MAALPAVGAARPPPLHLVNGLWHASCWTKEEAAAALRHGSVLQSLRVETMRAASGLTLEGLRGCCSGGLRRYDEAALVEDVEQRRQPLGLGFAASIGELCAALPLLTELRCEAGRVRARDAAGCGRQLRRLTIDFEFDAPLGSVTACGGRGPHADDALALVARQAPEICALELLCGSSVLHKIEALPRLSRLTDLTVRPCSRVASWAPLAALPAGLRALHTRMLHVRDFARHFGGGGDDDGVAAVGARLTALRELTLDECEPSRITALPRWVVPLMTRLEVLIITNNSVTELAGLGGGGGEEAAAAEGEEAEVLPMRVLECRRDSRWDGATAARLLPRAVAARMRRLEALRLHNAACTPEWQSRALPLLLPASLASVAAARRLTELDLSEAGLHEVPARLLQAAEALAPSLTALSLAHSRFVQPLPSAELGLLTSLRRLSLKEVVVASGGDHELALAETLAPLLALEELDISGCQLRRLPSLRQGDDADAEDTVLSRLVSLQRLAIGCNPFVEQERLPASLYTLHLQRFQWQALLLAGPYRAASWSDVQRQLRHDAQRAAGGPLALLQLAACCINRHRHRFGSDSELRARLPRELCELVRRGG